MADEGRRPGRAGRVRRRRQGALDRPRHAVRVRRRRGSGTRRRCATASTRSSSAPTARSRGRGTRSRVRVKNEPFTLAPVGFKPKQQVSRRPARPGGLHGRAAGARRCCYLDGRRIDHDTSPPYLFQWDTRRTKDGMHTLTLAGRARDGRLVRSTRPGRRRKRAPSRREDRRELARRRPDRVAACSTGSSQTSGRSPASSSSSTGACARPRPPRPTSRTGTRAPRRRARMRSGARDRRGRHRRRADAHGDGRAAAGRRRSPA